MPLRPLHDRDYYTMAEIAKAMGCSRTTVIRQIEVGRIPAVRVGRSGQRRCGKAIFRECLADHGIPADMLDDLERRGVLARALSSGRSNGHG